MDNGVNINKKTVLSSFVWKMLERVCSQGINLVVQIILARILLPKDFASLAIIVAITNYAAIFVQTGLATAIIQKKDIDDVDVSSLLTASLCIALIFYIILYYLSPSLSAYYCLPKLKWALRVLSLILFFNAFNSIQTAILSRRMHFKTQFVRTSVAVIISGTVGIVMAC
jgi:teichuronic acid exporter